MSQKALLEELVKQVKRQNEILEEILNEIQEGDLSSIYSNTSDIDSIHNELKEMHDSISNIENAVSAIVSMRRKRLM